MTPSLLVVEWVGAGLVLASWVLVRYHSIWAPAASMTGAALFFYFSLAIGAYGMMLVNACIALINLWTIWEWRKKR